MAFIICTYTQSSLTAIIIIIKFFVFSILCIFEHWIRGTKNTLHNEKHKDHHNGKYVNHTCHYSCNQITLPIDSAFSQFSELHRVDLYFIGSKERREKKRLHSTQHDSIFPHNYLIIRNFMPNAV